MTFPVTVTLPDGSEVTALPATRPFMERSARRMLPVRHDQLRFFEALDGKVYYVSETLEERLLRRLGD